MLRELIRTALAENIAVSLKAFHAVLRESGTYELSDSALRKHVSEHERDGWMALKAARLVRL